MRRIGRIVAILTLGLAAGAGRAGVYDLDEAPSRFPPTVLQTSQEDIQSVILAPLRNAQVFPVLDQPAEGIRQLAAATEARPKKFPVDWLTLAACYFRLDRPADAMKAVDKADGSGAIASLIAKKDRLEATPPDARTTADAINLGACCIRLGRYNDAVRVLSAADQRHFLVLANLAAAYHGMGELERAAGYEEQALDAWPASQPGWSSNELYWYHRVETYYLKLLRLRLRETLANPAATRWETMDALFDKPRSAGGPYEPSMPSWRMWGDVPPDGPQIVAQLLVWSPNDDRLYWQLGELLNSCGKVRNAYKILDELVVVRSRTGIRELQNHRAVLKEALPVVDAVDQAAADRSAFYASLYTLGNGLTPHVSLAPPVCGDLALAAGSAAWLPAGNAAAAQQQALTRMQLEEQLRQLGQPPPAPPAQPTPPFPAPPPNQSAGPWPEWRPLFVGFAAGLIVATLAALQFMEWRRRRRAAVADPPRPPAEFPQSRRTEPAVHDAGAIRTDAPSAPDRMEGAP